MTKQPKYRNLVQLQPRSLTANELRYAADGFQPEINAIGTHIIWVRRMKKKKKVARAERHRERAMG
jgi:hypothetical protein